MPLNLWKIVDIEMKLKKKYLTVQNGYFKRKI